MLVHMYMYIYITCTNTFSTVGSIVNLLLLWYCIGDNERSTSAIPLDQYQQKQRSREEALGK